MAKVKFDIDKTKKIIDELAEIVDSGKKFIGNNVLVNPDKINAKIDELRFAAPEEYERCSHILNNHENIIQDAKEEADKILSAANDEAYAMIEDTEIVRQAQERADEIMQEMDEKIQQQVDEVNNYCDAVVAEAQRNAQAIVDEAYAYVDSLLAEVEAVMKNSYTIIKQRTEDVNDSLKQNLQIVINNRKDIALRNNPDAVFEEDEYEDNNSQEPESEPNNDEDVIIVDDEDDDEE